MTGPKKLTLALNIDAEHDANGEGASEWRFAVRHKDIAEAIDAKLAYHRARLEFWANEQDEAEQAAKGKTQTRVVPITGGHQIQTLMDPTLAQRLEQCRGKLSQHRATIEELRVWRALFERESERLRDLSFADARRFGIGREFEEWQEA